VIRSDESFGRIGSVLEFETRDDRTMLLTLDYKSGDLIALEFDDSISGKRVRYEYGAYHAVSGCRVPAMRRLLLDGQLYQSDEFDSYEIVR